MQILKIYPNSINSRYIDQAVEAMRQGGIIVYPTDTLYALGCDALNKHAVERLCALKGLNPDKNLLSVVSSSLSQAAEYARIDNRAFQILKEYLPGPFTFILPASNKLPKVFKGRKTVGLRIPDNPISQALAEALGNPLLTASVDVNDMDEALITNPDSIAMAYESQAELLIDGGEGDVVASTVVDLSDTYNPEIVRQGKGEFEL